MHSIQIPAGNLTLQQIQLFAEKYNCEATWSDPHRAYFEITTYELINFFWLGANMAAAFMKSLDTPLSKGPSFE